MKNKEVKVHILPLDQIVPDELQPRKNFDPGRLAELMASIKEHGIINPLVVHQTGPDTYILVDGERRYRASKELKLKEVPAIIKEKTSDIERLIEQFHIQEQHEGWSALEKAVAVSRLAVEMNVGVREISKMLALPNRTVGQFLGFSKLIEKHEYQKQEIPVHYATHIVNLKAKAKKISMENLKKDFSREDESKLELAIIARIKSGEITKPIDLTKIIDSIVKEPTMLVRFMNEDNLSIDKMFISSDANVAKAYRQINMSAILLTGYIGKGTSVGVQKLFGENAESLANLVKLKHRLDDLINVIE